MSLALYFLISKIFNPSVSDKDWIISERSIPAPTAVSPEFHNIITAKSTPNILERRAFAPVGDSMWNSLIKKADAGKTEVVTYAARDLNIDIRKDTIAGATVFHITPAKIDPRFERQIFYFIHGGAYVFGKGYAGLGEALLIASRVGIKVISLDYRMPPEFPFPAGLNEANAVYESIVKARGAHNIILGGTSAGGGLAAAALQMALSAGLEAPLALFLGTPWVDLTKTGDTQFTNEGIDNVLVTYDGLLKAAAKLYAGNENLKSLAVSPLYGSFAGFPPTFLVSGTRDLFLSDTVRAHRKLRQAGIFADLVLFEGMSHAEYALRYDTAESEELYRELKSFILDVLYKNSHQ